MAMRPRGELVSAGLAALWLAAVILVDVAVDPGPVVFVSLFAFSPLIACVVLGPTRTAVFAAAAVLAAVGAGWWDGTWGTDQQVVRLVDTVMVSGIAVVIATVRVRQQRRYRRLVDIAEAAQRAILPAVPPVTGPVAVATVYVSATEDALVGGDLYDWHHSDGRTRFLVGDVRGKGTDAVGQAARVIRAFRQYAAVEPTLVRVAKSMDIYLRPHFDDEEFATACLVEVSGDVATIVSCGHPPPLMLSQRRGALLLEAPAGLPLGLGTSYSALSAEWWPGDRLLIYTDGLSEARDARGRFLSPLMLAGELGADTVDDALRAMVNAVRRHAASRHLTDDLAAVLLQLVTSTRSGDVVRWDKHTGTGAPVVRLPHRHTPAPVGPSDTGGLTISVGAERVVALPAASTGQFADFGEAPRVAPHPRGIPSR